MVSNAPQPASYAGNPQLGDRLAQLPERYEQGQQLAVTQALRTAFPGGLPTLPNGQLDANAPRCPADRLPPTTASPRRVRSLATGIFVGRDVPPDERFAAVVGASSPDADLTHDQVAYLRPIIGRTAQTMARAGASEVNRPAQDTSAADRRGRWPSCRARGTVARR
jgi:hypothetical protein